MVQFEINDNIHLKMLTDKDAEALFWVVDDYRQYLRQWLPWLDQNRSVEDSIAFIRSTHQQYQGDESFTCGIFFNGDLVGMCGFHPIAKLNFSINIGYWLAEKCQGQGIVTDCVRFLIDYACNQLNLNKVSIPAAEFNYKSQAVSKRLGLVNEGIERDGEFLYDHFVNLVRYSLLRSEWNVHHP